MPEILLDLGLVMTVPLIHTQGHTRMSIHLPSFMATSSIRLTEGKKFSSYTPLLVLLSLNKT